jgi:RimJ/RimL family protein N-acetyltransferase
VSVPTLSTERLLLRQWRPGDREPFAAMNADPLVMEHFPAPLTRAESDALVDRIEARLEADGFGLWAAERRSDGAFLGFIGLARHDFPAHFAPCVEVGWRLAVDAWGHGYATEGAQAALAHGFETIGLDEIVSFTVPANVRSIRVMERLGMTRDPTDDFDHPRIPAGHPLRHQVLYRLGAERWAARPGLIAQVAPSR